MSGVHPEVVQRSVIALNVLKGQVNIAQWQRLG
jgi:hypothetical protein